MTLKEIHIRDPFIVKKDGQYYMYGTRTRTTFGLYAGRFDVFVSADLVNWSARAHGAKV